MDLELTGDVARLPRALKPMLARPGAPFDSAEHEFEPRWGGRRAIAFVDPGASGGARLRLIDDNGADMAPRLPELWSIPDLVAGGPAILDGEVVLPDRSGHADDLALASRLAGGEREGSAVYLAFDLLWTGARPILSEPLVRRRERLARSITPNAELVLLPGVVGEGLDLCRAVAEQGLPGVMARHLRGPYLPGRRSDLWRWIESIPGEIIPDRNPEPPGPHARPVLTLIARLPLDD